MRNAIIKFILSILLIIYLGCSPNIGSGGIDNVTVDNVYPENCGSGVCYYTYTISFDDPDIGVYYYWGELVNGANQAVGKPIQINNTGQRITIEVTAHYFDILNALDYFVVVNRCDGLLYGWKPDYVNYKTGQISWNQSLGSFDMNCWQNCCTDPSTTLKPRWYVSAFKDISNIVAVKGDIRTVWGNTLCGGSSSTSVTSCFSYVNISNPSEITPTSPTGIWAQAGLIHWRYQGDTETFKKVYFEVKGLVDLYREFWNAPPYNSINTYMVTIDPANGEIIFGHSLVSDTVIDPDWIDKTGTFVSWSGELYTRETDMPGTSNTPCLFETCGYLRIGDTDFQPPNWAIDEYKTDDTNEWQIYIINSTDFLIWDVNPLP